MGNRRSASGWKNWKKNGKAERQEIRANLEARKQAGKEFKKHPTGVRCVLCGQYVEKLQQVRRADLTVVPGCAACAKLARESAVLPAAPGKAQKAPAAPSTARPTVITPRRPVQDDLGALGLLMRSAFTRSGDLLALPAPRLDAAMRPVRRQLALMVGARPRYIPSGPVMAMGPGDKPSPYDPEAIEQWHQRFLREMAEAVELRAKVLTGEGIGKGERGVHHPIWEADCAAQRMQHAAFVFANLMMAV